MIAGLVTGLALLATVPQHPPAPGGAAPIVVRGETVHTLHGAALTPGVVVVQQGKIIAVGRAADVVVPAGARELTAKVVTPGLIDAHATVGLSGLLNVPHDQDQLERSNAMQPELRALDAFNPRDELVAWVRSFGVTTVHTGHGPGALISGQTMAIKTHGRSVEQDVVRPLVMVAVTLGDGGRGDGGKAPGTRAKAVAMLREQLLATQAYVVKRGKDAAAAVDLGHETLAKVLAGEVPLLITAHRAYDLASALRVADEFGVRVVLDGAAEAYLMLPQLLLAKVVVLPHPAMARTGGELANGTMRLPALLHEAGVPFALQSGYESYVPKTRVVLLEAAVAVGRGLPAEVALRALTIDAARLCGIDGRTGSIAVGKDADLALYDGDPFEYTTHCLGTVIDGVPYLDSPR